MLALLAVRPRGTARVITRCLALPTSIFIAATLGAIGVVAAQQTNCNCATTADFNEHLAFDAADTNGDGFVSEAELARDAAVGFASLDKDGSMTLTPQELGPHDPAAFARVDRNGDGILTFTEVMINKMEGSKAADKNHDDLLSFEEMVTEVKIEEGVP